VRVRQVADLADTAPRHPAEAARIAAEALNLGALIASDCGLAALARSLCWRQFGIFHGARPFDAATAKLALQPLVNLGRLRARDGTGPAAHRLIEALFTAVRHQAAVNLDGTIADLGHLTRTPDDHRDIIQWLWTVLLADGTRALTRAGRWSQALQHVQDHHGIGRSLLDGRQIAIIAHHWVGDHRTSARLLAETTTPTTWEQTVAACLAVLTGNDNGNATTIVDSYLALDEAPGQAVFRTRLGLAILDLTDDRSTPRLVHAIETDVLQTQDAYAAREVLAHTPCASLIPASTIEALTGLVDASGLGTAAIPTELVDQLTTAMTTAEASLTKALTVAT
jgi:hypothetical protein